jgi:hypothetical protein
MKIKSHYIKEEALIKMFKETTASSFKKSAVFERKRGRNDIALRTMLLKYHTNTSKAGRLKCK